MDEKTIATNVGKIAKKFNIPEAEVKAQIEATKKNAMEAYSFDEAGAMQFAFNAYIGALRAKANSNEEEFQVIITGTDGRINDWAAVNKKKIQKEVDELKKKGATDADIVAKQLKNAQGEYLYPQSDKYRKGKPIPASDISVTMGGMANIKGKLVPVSISSKDVSILEFAANKQVYKITGFKQQNSTANQLNLSVKDKTKIVVEKAVNNSAYLNTCKKAYGNLSANFDALVKMCENIPDKWDDRRITLENVMINNVQSDIGPNKNYLVGIQFGDVLDSLDNPNTEKYPSIIVWLPKELGFVPYQNQIVSVHGQANKADTEKGQLALNAFSIWCDDKFVRKEVPKLPDAPAKADEKKEEEVGWN